MKGGSWLRPANDMDTNGITTVNTVTGTGYTNISTKSESINETKVDIIQKVKQNPGYVPTVAESMVIKTIEDANKKLVSTNTELRLSIHEATKKMTIKIVDKNSEEVIREYPPEKLLDIFAKMIELSGMIVDEKR